ncbi:MAG: M48 family metalloprotease [Aquisalinus sp.]|nr:M48 family metalloprotease [Aquisalinus sp.]
MHLRLNIFLLGIWLGLTGCISTQHQLPAPEPGQLAQTQSEMQAEAIAFQMKRRARLYDLSWPLLEVNAAICPNTRRSIGVVLADLEMYADLIGGLSAEQLETHGIADDIHVFHVIKGSPAAMAGLTDADFIRAVNGEEVETDKPGELVRLIRQGTEDDEPVQLTVENPDGTRTLEVLAAEVCDVLVKLSTSSALNALAQDKTMIVNAGLMRSADDDMVQYIMAHELAHLALRHARKGTWNTIASGAVLYGPVLYAGGAVIDRTLEVFGQNSKRSFARQGLARAMWFSQMFEAEADYVGLYMLARADGNIDGAAEVFRLFAREAPASTWLRYTHPLTPERVAALEIAVKEIQAKQARGEQLFPERVE